MPKSAGPRNFLHAEDAVDLLLAANQTAATGVLDVVSPEFMTYHEIGMLAFDIFNKGGQVLVDSSKTPFRPISFPSGEASYQTLGRVPSISIAEGITRIRDRNTWPAFGPLDVT